MARDDLVLGDVASTRGLPEALEGAGLTAFQPSGDSRIVRDEAHGTFAMAGAVRDASGATVVGALAGRVDRETGEARVTGMVLFDATRDVGPDSTARRALKGAGMAVRRDELVAAAGGSELRLAVTKAEVEAATSPLGRGEGGTAHGRLLALAAREAVVTTWGDGGRAGGPAVATGRKLGRNGLEHLAATFGKGELRTMGLDVGALARRLEPDEVAGAATLLREARALDPARRERLAGRSAGVAQAPRQTPRQMAGEGRGR